MKGENLPQYLLWLIIFCIEAVLLLPSTSCSQIPKKRALLIGISDYNDPVRDGKFDDIDTYEDVKLIKQVLMDNNHH